MSPPRLHFGLPGLKGHLAGYARAFDLLEVRADPAVPTTKHLARLRREAPEGFSFALVVGKGLAELPSGDPDAALVESTRRAAETLGARWLLLRTPASAGPSARTRTKLARLVERLAGVAGGIAWEPRGAWTDEELIEVSTALGVTLVRDLAEQEAPEGKVVYTRLLALGRNSRLGSGAIERVAERLEGAEEAFVVIEGEGGAGVAKRLKAALGQAALDAAAEQDDEDLADEDGAEGEDEDFDGGDEE
jgi:uncharacterized protein YecE (DUF72 family)